MLSRTTTALASRCCRAVATIPARSLASEPLEPNSKKVLTGERGVNNVTLLGRIGRTPELRGNEKHPVVIFSLATSQSFRSPEGNFQQQTEWHNISVFSPGLRNFAEKLKTGDRVYIQGNIHYNRVPEPDSTNYRQYTYITASDLMLMSSPRSAVRDMADEDAPQEPPISYTQESP